MVMSIRERRIHDALTIPAEGATVAELEVELQALGDAVRAAQSTDDEGEKMNKKIWSTMNRNLARWREVTAKLGGKP